MGTVDWLESLRDALILNVGAGLIVYAIFGIGIGIGTAVLGALFFGRNYKQRIAALERALERDGTQPPQPMIQVTQKTRMGYLGNTQIPGDVAEIKVMSRKEFDMLPEKKDKTLYLTYDE